MAYGTFLAAVLLGAAPLVEYLTHTLTITQYYGVFSDTDNPDVLPKDSLLFLFYL